VRRGSTYQHISLSITKESSSAARFNFLFVEATKRRIVGVFFFGALCAPCEAKFIIIFTIKTGAKKARKARAKKKSARVGSVVTQFCSPHVTHGIKRREKKAQKSHRRDRQDEVSRVRKRRKRVPCFGALFGSRGRGSRGDFRISLRFDNEKPRRRTSSRDKLLLFVDLARPGAEVESELAR
jgi:hypothetical protein